MTEGRTQRNEEGKGSTGAEETEVGGRPSYRALFRSRSFSSLWLAQVISQSGDGIFDVAILWVVLQLTHSTFLVGLTQAVVLAPGIIVGPAAGVFADRHNRKVIMIWSALFQGAVTAAMSFLYVVGRVTFPPLLLLVLLLFAGAEFYRAANGAMIPSLVPRENLGAANGLFSLSTSANQLVSYSVGGIALFVVGAALSISYDSLTFFAAAGLLTMIVSSYGSPREGPVGPTSGASFRRDFRDGLAYVKGNRLFIELSVFGLMANFFGAGMGTIIAPYVEYQLGGNEISYGLLLSSIALGAIAGAILVGKVNFRRYVGKLLFGGVFAFGPVAIAASLVNSVIPGLVVFFVVGVLAGAVNLPIQALVQTTVPREMLGRATTVLRALLGIATPVSALFFGALAGVSSTSTAYLLSGAGISVVTLVLYAPFKELRNAKY